MADTALLSRATYRELDALDEISTAVSEIRSEWRFIAMSDGPEVESLRAAIRNFEILTGVKL